MNPYASTAPEMPPLPPMPETDTSWIRRQYCDIPYGPAEAQKFNVYLPQEGDGPFPTVVFIHGGAFVGGHRTDPQLKPYLELVKYGLALVSLDHRLSGEVVFPQGLRDCTAALSFLRENGGKWNLDMGRLGLLGDSAGANFALMLCAGCGDPLIYDGEPDPVAAKCCVTWFAPTDFLAMNEAFLADDAPGMHEAGTHNGPYSPESIYLGGPLPELDPAYVRSADPTGYVTPSLPPVLMQHGRMDHVVHWSQSKLFADRVDEVCGPGRVTLELFPEADHADPAFETEENMARVARFFLEYLG